MVFGWYETAMAQKDSRKKAYYSERDWRNYVWTAWTPPRSRRDSFARWIWGCTRGGHFDRGRRSVIFASEIYMLLLMFNRCSSAAKRCRKCIAENLCSSEWAWPSKLLPLSVNDWSERLATTSEYCQSRRTRRESQRYSNGGEFDEVMILL